jgi:hypothetical protein
MYFDKTLRNAGITANGLFDNETNGYQSINALGYHINGFVAPFIQWYYGIDYSTTKIYVITGAGDRSTNGVLFYNGNVCYFESNTGPACGGGTVDVLQLQTYTKDGLKVLKCVCGASGSGVTGNSNSDFSNLVRPISYGQAVPPTYSGTYIPDATLPITVRRERNRVYVEGLSNNASPLTIGTNQTVMTLPVGFRPARTIYRRLVSGSYTNDLSPNQATWNVNMLSVTSSGVVTVYATSNALVTTNDMYFSFDFDVN